MIKKYYFSLYCFLKYFFIFCLKIKKTKEFNYEWELCPSVPALRAWVKRFNALKVRYFNDDYEEIEEELEGFKARVFQHELDHQMGLTFLDWRV